MKPEGLTFENDGAQLFNAALSKPQLRDLENSLGPQPREQAGVRIFGIPELHPFLDAAGAVGRFPASVIGAECLPVRAILFDKNADQNWSLGWHQDRTIAVKQRIDAGGFGPWSVKGGMVHVEPPFDVLESMVTVRVHLDDVPTTNAPLLIAPTSHKYGRILAADIPMVVEKCGILECLADAGDIWLYATPILHASEAAIEPLHRRVLQVDYAKGQLPHGLEWLGI